MKINQVLLEESKKIYFASDFHLGNTSHEKSLLRERKIVSWLDSIADDAQAIFLVGDIFDFWYEYKHVVPKGYVRFLGKLASLSDKGIEVIFFSGNHDLWMRDYLEEELGAIVFQEPQSININEKSFHIGHGDGLGPGDMKYKFLKLFFKSRICQWLFGWVHPSISFTIARAWSRKSSSSQADDELIFENEREQLVFHCREVEQEKHHDYYIFGHRHIPIEYKLSDESLYVNLGEWWISDPSYAVFDGKNLRLESFTDET